MRGIATRFRTRPGAPAANDGGRRPPKRTTAPSRSVDYAEAALVLTPPLTPFG